MTGDYGPQTGELHAFLDRVGRLAGGEVAHLGEVWAPERGPAWDAAWQAAWASGRDPWWWELRDAAWQRCAGWAPGRSTAWWAVWEAAAGLLVRDLVDPEVYRRLAGPWQAAVGPLHPDDEPEARP